MVPRLAMETAARGTAPVTEAEPPGFTCGGLDGLWQPGNMDQNSLLIIF
jgi:hypothetical protein